MTGTTAGAGFLVMGHAAGRDLGPPVWWICDRF